MPGVIPTEIIHGAVELVMFFITGLFALFGLMMTARP